MELPQSYRNPNAPRIACVVDGVRVDVVVCWKPELLAQVQEKWPNGVDIAELAKPGYEGFGTKAERGWLVRVARMRAGKSAPAVFGGAVVPTTTEVQPATSELGVSPGENAGQLEQNHEAENG